MTFAWSNLSKSTLMELARAAGLTITRAQQELTEKYGEVPGEDFVIDLWKTLRDGWVKREPVARSMIVDALRARHLGDMTIKVGNRASQLEYLRSCKVSSTLRLAVLEALHTVGSLPYDTPADVVTTPDDERSLPMTEWLRRTCLHVNHASLPATEISACLEIGRVLKGVKVPVADADRPHLVGEVVRAAVLGAHAYSKADVEQDTGGLPHYAWVLDGAKRIAQDRTVQEQALMAYADHVDKILNGGAPDTYTASMTCLSMFVSVLAFPPQGNPSTAQSQQLVEELASMAAVLEPSGDDAPTALRDLPDTDDEPQAAEAPSYATLADFVGSSLSGIAGLQGPMSAPNQIAWMMPAGSALVKVMAVTPDNDEPELIRYYSVLLKGATQTPELLSALNLFNLQESYFKMYAVEDRVVMEYDQMVDKMTTQRIRTTLGWFLGAADHFDNVLQDRFGGSTQSASVKARFDA